MFIRATVTKNKNNNTSYTTHKLVESYRTEKGSRQRVVMNLGQLDLPKKYWRKLASVLESRIKGQKSFLDEDIEITSLADDILEHHDFIVKQKNHVKDIRKNSDIQLVDLNSVAHSFSRSLGPELIGYKFWEDLLFDKIFKICNFTDKQISIAKALILGRLINPQSEYSTWKWFKKQTSLIEMTTEDISNVGKDCFYEITDLLFDNKDIIEQELFKRETLLFNLDRNLYLYDLTNTYFEGSMKNNDKANFARSKEKRSDCPLISLSLVVDQFGFPIMSQIYEGNVSEPKTLKDVLDKLDSDLQDSSNNNKPILVMDRGIATAPNIALIKDRCYGYTVINRREATKDYEDEFLKFKAYLNDENEHIPEGWEYLNDKKEVYFKKISDYKNKDKDENIDKHKDKDNDINNDIVEILSVSIGRSKKEESINKLKEERFNEAMNKLKNSFDKGNIVCTKKISERIGRIKATYSSAAKYYTIDVITYNDDLKVKEILWYKKSQEKKENKLNGCYVIETTQKSLTAKKIWEQYMTLHKVENAFSDLKSELGLRPIYHQKEERASAHLFIAVLAYHILISIENNLKSKGDNREWNSIKKILSTHQRNLITMQNNENKTIYIRASGIPEPEHNKIYRTLDIKDPLKKIRVIK